MIQPCIVASRNTARSMERGSPSHLAAPEERQQLGRLPCMAYGWLYELKYSTLVAASQWHGHTLGSLVLSAAPCSTLK